MSTDLATYGLLPQGFVPATAAQLLALVQRDQQALIDPDYPAFAEGPEGAINSVVITHLAEVWELAGAVVAACNPGGASFQALDGLCQLTGTLRNSGELDAPLRLRRQQALTPIPRAALPAMYPLLLAVTATIGGVASTKVVQALTLQQNTLPIADGLGRPPHSVEAIVQWIPGLAGADLAAARAAFALALWQSKLGGIQTVGSQSGTVIDADGEMQTVNWTEATQVPVWITLEAKIDAATYGGDITVINAIQAYFDALDLGMSVIRNRILTIVLGVPGISDVASLVIGTAPSPSLTANISVDARSVAVLRTVTITDEDA